MLGPVPLVTLPRCARANIRAASMIEPASMPARGATRSGVNGATAAASAPNPSVSASMKARSQSPSVMMTLSIAASSGTSWPGRHCRCRSALRADSVRRGSMTMSFRPRCRASCSRFAGLNDGMPPHIETSGFAPISMQTSASAKSCGPAPHLPCSAIEIGLPGWSMVALEKRIGEPMASMNDSRSITPAGQKWLKVPPYIATDRGP